MDTIMRPLKFNNTISTSGIVNGSKTCRIMLHLQMLQTLCQNCVFKHQTMVLFATGGTPWNVPQSFLYLKQTQQADSSAWQHHEISWFKYINWDRHLSQNFCRPWRFGCLFKIALPPLTPPELPRGIAPTTNLKNNRARNSDLTKMSTKIQAPLQNPRWSLYASEARKNALFLVAEPRTHRWQTWAFCSTTRPLSARWKNHICSNVDSGTLPNSRLHPLGQLWRSFCFNEALCDISPALIASPKPANLCSQRLTHRKKSNYYPSSPSCWFLVSTYLSSTAAILGDAKVILPEQRPVRWFTGIGANVTKHNSASHAITEPSFFWSVRKSSQSDPCLRIFPGQLGTFI